MRYVDLSESGRSKCGSYPHLPVEDPYCPDKVLGDLRKDSLAFFSSIQHTRVTAHIEQRAHYRCNLFVFSGDPCVFAAFPSQSLGQSC